MILVISGTDSNHDTFFFRRIPLRQASDVQVTSSVASHTFLHHMMKNILKDDIYHNIVNRREIVLKRKN